MRSKCIYMYSHIYMYMYIATLENEKGNSVVQRNS